MNKYLVTATIPARDHREVVAHATPEEAAKAVRDRLGPAARNVVVAEVGVDLDERVALDFCALCRLPIWIDDEINTYRRDDHDQFVHCSCQEGA